MDNLSFFNAGCCSLLRVARLRVLLVFSSHALSRGSVLFLETSTGLKVFKYGVISGAYFPVFGLNAEKYRPEKSPCLDTFHAMQIDHIIQ